MMGDDPVARFYQEHPYPPPVDDLAADRVAWAAPARRRTEYHRLFPVQPFRENLDVLVAGCGTSQAVRHALRWPAGRVVGIDVSETSVQATERLRRRHGLENLEVHRLPVERVAELDRDFDLIICTGVLHHLADPDAGLGALRRVLRSSGVMMLMVYASYGRTGVTMIQEYARRLGIGATEGEIRDLAQTLAAIPPHHPLEPLLRNSPDFRRIDALADALLNPRERTYSVPELFDYVERNGLVFGRWYRQAPYRPQCGAVASTPHARALAALPEPEQFVALELFRGTMVRHSLIVHRSDAPRDPGFRFDAGDLTVPIRLPDAMAVKERLPPGAAAVLLNRSHTYTDLVLAVDEPELALYEAIDGQTSVSELAAAAGSDQTSDGVTDFLRTLWFHDQIVFDGSPGAGG